MKKNFSFLKSLLALFVVSLFSANASAEEVWKRVMNAGEINDSCIITFVHEKDPADPYAGGYQYKGYRETAVEYGVGIPDSTQESGLPLFTSASTRFEVTASKNNKGYFILKQLNVKEGADSQLYQDGTLLDAGDTKEGVWQFTFAEGEDVALMHTANEGNNFVWNDGKKCFLSSTVEGKVAIYKKVVAEKPTLAEPKIFRAYKGMTEQYVNVATTTDGAQIWYYVGSDKKVYVNSEAQSYDVNILKEAYGTADSKEVRLSAYTQIGYGQTKVTSDKYKFYRLDTPTFDTTEVTVGANGYTDLKITAAGAQTIKVEIDGEDVTDSPYNYDLYKYAGGSVKIKVTASRPELSEPVVVEQEITVNKFRSAGLGWKADPTENSVVASGDLITITAYADSAYTVTKPASITALTWKNGEKEVTSACKFDTLLNVLTTKVPAALRGDGEKVVWKLQLPAGLFVADSKGDVTEKNKVTSAAAEIAYKPSYAPIAFTINPDQKEFITDGTTDLVFNVAVYPAGAAEGKETIAIPDSAIRVTDSENKNLTGKVGINGENGVYTVTFPVSAIKDYISDKNTPVDLMFSIEEGQIKCTSANSVSDVDYTTNNADVVAYVRFYESVDIQLGDIAPVGKFCTVENRPTIKFPIIATGKASGKSYNVSLAEGAIATITGTDADGNPQEKTAAIIVKDSVASVTVPAGLNGRGNELYSIAISDSAFYVQTGSLEETRSFSAGKEYAKVLDARAHSKFTAEVSNKYQPTNTFEVTVKAVPQNGNIIEGLQYVGEGETVTIVNGESEYKGTVTSFDNGVATIETEYLIEVGTYTVKFNPAVFTVDCDKNKSLSAELVVEDVVWSLDKEVYAINDEQTEFKVKVAATFNDSTITITNAPEELTGKIDKTPVTLKKGEVVNDSVIYTVTTAKLPADGDNAITYKLTIDDEQLEAQTRPNTTLRAKVEVNSYVNYSLVTKNVTNIDTKTTEYIFEIKLTDKNDSILTRDLKANLSDYVDPAPSKTIAFNSGFGSNYPTVKFVDEDTVEVSDKQQKYILTEFTNLKQGNYQFNIPAHTLYADANDNDNKMYINFSVKNHIAMSWAADIDANVDELGDITEDSLTYTADLVKFHSEQDSLIVNVKGWDVEVGNDASNLINLQGSAAFLIDSTPVTTTALGGGKFKLTFDPLAAGNHTLTVPAKALKASNTENVALTMPIEVYAAPTFKGGEITAIQGDKVATLAKVVVNGTITDATATVTDKDGETVSATIAYNEADVTVTFDDAVVSAKAPYTVTFAAGSITTNEGTTNADSVVWTINVTNNFIFVDNGPGACKSTKEFTKASEIKPRTYDKVTYKRVFNGTWETLALPFSITADEAAANGWEIYRLITVAYECVDMSTGDKVNRWFVQPVTTQTQPNMPYFIRGNASKSEYVFEDLEIVESQAKTLSITTAKQEITVTTVAGEDKQTPTNFWYLSDKNNGAFKLYASAGVFPYRWYLTMSDINEDYSNLRDVFEVVDDATAINAISAENANGDIYNVAGQKLNSLQKGINIVNGKKVLVK